MGEVDRMAGEAPAVRRATPTGPPRAPGMDFTLKPKSTQRPRITAEDVEARFTAFRAERSERKENRDPVQLGRVVRVVVASVLGVGIAGFALGINTAGEKHAEQVAANQDKISSLTSALAALSPTDGKDTTEKLTHGLEVAQWRSDELAQAQQQFAEIAEAGNTQASTNDGRPNAAALRSLAHRKDLVGFFAPEALLLDEAQAYSFRTEDLLGPGMIDPRQPWFTRYEPVAGQDESREAAEASGYTWKATSVTLSGTPGVMSVVWTNTDTTSGDLLAWATARYSVDSDSFSDLRVSTSSLGESQQLKAGAVSPAPENDPATTAKESKA